MGTVTLGRHSYGYTLTPSGPDGEWRSILVQTDYDYPGVAGTFGWWPGMVPVPPDYAYPVAIGDFRSCPSEHDGTDGTVACPTCGQTASAFIASAADWLDDHDGATADDPGYFGED